MDVAIFFWIVVVAVFVIIIVAISKSNSDDQKSDQTSKKQENSAKPEDSDRPKVYMMGNKSASIFTPPEKRAGNAGEDLATHYIAHFLQKDDSLLANVSLEYDGRRAEFDNIIVNKYGVFIIEVKNYIGKLYGSEDEYEWQKYKTDDYGNEFQKTVKNPIKQVKREIYILAKYLASYGVDVWVEGYAYFVQCNCPIQSEHVLYDANDIAKALHTCTRKMLGKTTTEKIVQILRGK